MNCNDVRPLINAFIDGELAELEARRVEHHIEKCESCCAEAGQFRKTRDLISTHGGEKTPASLLNDIKIRMEKEKTATADIRPLRKTGWWALAASFALVLLGGVYFNIFNLNAPIETQNRQMMAAAPAQESMSAAGEAVSDAMRKEKIAARVAGGGHDAPAADAAAADTASAAEEESPAPAPRETRRARASSTPTPQPAGDAAPEMPAARTETAPGPAESRAPMLAEAQPGARGEYESVSATPAGDSPASRPDHSAGRAASEAESEDDMTEREIVLAQVREAFDRMERQLEMERILGGESGSGEADATAAGGSVAAPAAEVAPAVAGPGDAGRVVAVSSAGAASGFVPGGFSFIEEVPHERESYAAARSGPAAFSAAAAPRNVRRVLRAEDFYSVENPDAAAADCERIIEQTLEASADGGTRYIRDGRRLIIRGAFSSVDPLRRELIRHFTGREAAGEADINGIPSGTSTQPVPGSLITILEINFTH